MEFQNLLYNAHNIFVESILEHSNTRACVFIRNFYKCPILSWATVCVLHVFSAYPQASNRSITIRYFAGDKSKRKEFSGQLISDIKKLPFTRGNNLSKNHGNSFTVGKSRELHTARKREREGWLGVLLWDCVSLGFYVLYPSGFAIR